MALIAPLGIITAADISGFSGNTWYDYRDTSFNIDGKGSLDNPIVVSTAEQLAQIAWLVNEGGNTFQGKVVALGADIDLKRSDNTKPQWIPIGRDETHCFKGVFIGVNPSQEGWEQSTHKISNMYIRAEKSSYTDYFGLFGYCSGFIGYVGLDYSDVYVTKTSSVFQTVSGEVGSLCGSMIGTAINATDRAGKTFQVPVGIYSVSVTNARINGEKLKSSGGIVGTDKSNGVCHSSFAGAIYIYQHSVDNVGGICGILERNTGTVFDCVAQVNISGGRTVGGIVGIAYNGARIEACASSGTFTNGTFAGGICGQQYHDVQIVACTSAANISGNNYIGGITGVSGNNGQLGGKATVSCCVFSGYLNATGNPGMGGVSGFMSWNENQFVDRCLFLGAMEKPTSTGNYGFILGNNSDPLSAISSCYIDKTICGSGMVAGQKEEHPTVMQMITQDLTTGDQSKTPLLEGDANASSGFIFQAGFYPRAYSNNAWPAMTQFKASGCSEACRKLFNQADMLADNSVSLTQSWLCSVPVTIQKGDCALDFVSTAEAKRANTNVLLSNGRKIRLSCSCQFPETTCIDINDETAIAREDGLCVLPLKSMAEVSTAFDRPKALQGSKEVRLNITVNQVWDGTIGTACAMGTGIAEDPYIIKNGAQLAYAVLNNKVGEFYEQICDITLYENRHIEPALAQPYKNVWLDKYSWPKDTALWLANYDGAGHYVKGACVTKNGMGLFGNIASKGSVSNLGIVDSHAPMQAGLFAGMMDGTITNCIAQGTVGMIHSGDADYYKDFSGGICSLVGPNNANAVIEDCIAAVYTGPWAFEDFSPFVSLSDKNKGVVRNCLAVVPIIHQDINFNNNGITASGKSYIKDCYWLKGYEEANSGQTLEEISGQLGKRRQWQTTNGYFPTLTTFAESDMAKLLTIPFRTDIDYVYDEISEASDNYLLGFGRQIPFEPGSATWTCSDYGNFFMEADADLGIIVPVRESFNPADYKPGTTARTLGGLEFMIAQLGKFKHYIPMRPTKGAVNAGFSFVDDNARKACLEAFDSNNNGTLSLAELKEVTNEQTLTAFQTATARLIKQFPEFRFFKNVTELTSQLHGMSSLEEVTMPYALQTIGSEAFKGCSSLKEVTVPSKVTDVMPRAFYGSSVENIIADQFNDTFTSRDGVLFTKKNELVAYPNGRDSEEAAIAGTVKRIAEGAIYKVPNLKRLFFDTTDYTTVPKPAYGAIVSADASSLIDVYVSDATIDHVLFDAYKSAPEWSQYVKDGKLHRYFPLKVPEDVTVKVGDVTRYVGTFYIGFATQLPKELTPYVVNALDAKNYTAYVHEKSRLVPATEPVMVYADRPGLFRLLPVEDEVEDWPDHGNWLLGLERDPMRINQSTSAQGSILTPQMNDEGQMAFLYEKKKQIDPYHCYLTFPTIDQSAELVKDAHYDVTYSEHSYGYVTRGDYVFDIRIMLPKSDLYAVLTRYQGVGGNITVPPYTSTMYSSEAPVTQIAPGAFNGSKGDIWSIDMSQLDDLDPIVVTRSEADGSSVSSGPLSGLDPRTIVYLPKGKAIAADNVVVGEECQKLMLTDGWDFCPPYEFRTQKGECNRVFSAIDNGDGTWTSKAYSVCSPYPVILDQCVDNLDDVSLFYLLYIDAKTNEFIFTNDGSKYLAPGNAYVLVVHKGSITLNVDASDTNYFDEDNAARVVPEPIEDHIVPIKKSDGQVEAGLWRGTYRTYSNDECAEMLAYIIQSSGTYKRVRNDQEKFRQAYVSGFRAIFTPYNNLSSNSYKIKYQYHEEGGGEEDDPTLLDNPTSSTAFPADLFESDGDMSGYDDEVTGVSDIKNTKTNDSNYYDLQGRQILNGQSLNRQIQRGIYINHGKKVIIK